MQQTPEKLCAPRLLPSGLMQCKECTTWPKQAFTGPRELAACGQAVDDVHTGHATAGMC